MRTATLCMVAFGLTNTGRLAAQRDDPPTSVNVRAELQESEGVNGDRQVYVTNGSSHTIVVTSVRLTDCENIQNCGTNRVKTTIGPGGRVMVLRVRLRFPDQSSSFRYSFTWEPEREEGPTAADAAKDPRALVIDTVVVTPKVVDLKVGETLNLSQVLSIKAMNAKGAPFPQVFFRAAVVVGDDIVSLDGPNLTGKRAGTAALLVSASLSAVDQGSSKGATKILVQVTP